MDLHLLQLKRLELAESTVVMPLGSSAAGPGYEPATITVSPGATVVWDNQDNALHTATSGESPAPDGRFDTGLIGKNKESLPVTMPSEPGDYEYFCVLHPFLTGKVIISTTPPGTTTKGSGSGS
jgi:plastocyanin